MVLTEYLFPHHTLKFDLFKIRTRSPKPYEVFIVPQCYIHAFGSHAPTSSQDILHTKHYANKIRTKNNVPLPFGGGM